VEGVFGEWVADALFGLVGLFGNDGKEGIPGLAFFIQGKRDGIENEYRNFACPHFPKF
jgi:hypothetical protein